MSKSTSNEVQDRRTILKEQDPEIFEAIQAERKRQNEGIELIASENYVSPAVLSAMGSVLTNKYAEGVPGHRYYGGCQWVDVAENLAIDRVKKLFGAEHANVQPHAGAQANAAAYFAMIQPGDAVLALKLDQGGHLTHGSNVNFSGKLYKFHQYGVHKDTERIDYEEVAILAEKFRPRLIVTGASAYPRFFDFPKLRDIADSVGAYLMMDMAHIAGLIAAGLHPNPIPYCDVVTSTTHKTLRGPRGGLILCKESLGKKVDSAVFPGLQGGPLMHIIAAKAVAFGEALKPEFKLYAQQILNNAQALASGLLEKGLRLVSGGTDNHLMLVDLRSINVSGKDAETALDNANIHTNKNMIPYDPAKPTVTSGIRLGSQCCATRGMGENDMKKIANWIYDVIAQYEDTSVQDRVRSEVINFCSQFPIPGIG